MKVVAFVAAIIATFVSSSVDAAEVKFLHTTAIKAAVDELIPLFETKTGKKVAPSYGPAGAIVQRVRSGETFDVVIATSSQIPDLEKEGIKVSPAQSNDDEDVEQIEANGGDNE